MAMRTTAPECPHCGGGIEPSHYAEQRTEFALDRFLLCDFCGVGWEKSEYADGGAFVLDYHAATEPQSFGAFKQRLRDALMA